MSLWMLSLQNETSASCPDLTGQGYRASFHTHSAARGPRKKIYHGHLDGTGPRKGEQAVVKVFRDAAGTEQMCDSEIKKHKLARKLAKKFNKLVMDQQYRINFTLPLKSTVERLGIGCYLTRHKTRHMDKNEWVLIEENLLRHNEYQVFIRKTGERLSSDPTTLDAFVHFTYHESEGHFLLCGFQGVHTDNGYLLTTPCIHSMDRSFGSSTDNGPWAIRRVFHFHQCNNLCYSFMKPEKSLEETEVGIGEDKTHKATAKLCEIPDKGVMCNDMHEDEHSGTENHSDQRSGNSKGFFTDRKKHKFTSFHRNTVKALQSIKKTPSF